MAIDSDVAIIIVLPGGVYKTKTKNRRPESLFILQLLKLQRKKHAKNALLDYKHKNR